MPAGSTSGAELPGAAASTLGSGSVWAVPGEHNHADEQEDGSIRDVDNTESDEADDPGGNRDGRRERDVDDRLRGADRPALQLRGSAPLDQRELRDEHHRQAEPDGQRTRPGTPKPPPRPP